MKTKRQHHETHCQRWLARLPLLQLKLAAKPIRRSDAFWSPAANVFWNDRRELTPISIKSNL
jgi:hypothetical protein